MASVVLLRQADPATELGSGGEGTHGFSAIDAPILVAREQVVFEPELIDEHGTDDARETGQAAEHSMKRLKRRAAIAIRQSRYNVAISRAASG
jgi:hypothetical protein